MHRLFCSPKNIDKDLIKISEPDKIHHIKDVLRLNAGEKVVVCDGEGNEYHSLIESLSGSELLLKVINIEKKPPKQEVNLTIACALPKKAKFDDIVDKLTQLGVRRIIPLETERVIVKLDKSKSLSRFKRWLTISESASCQSQRSIMPIVEHVQKFDKLLAESDQYDVKLIPALTGNRKSLKGAFSAGCAKNILILIGPEGDFTPAEVFAAEQKGFIPVTLGDLVLRVDTAAIAIAAYIRFQYFL